MPDKRSRKHRVQGSDPMKRNSQDLELQWRQFYALPFPERERWEQYATRQELDELDDLHGSLAEYDGFIAGLISQAVSGATRLSHPLERDPDLRRRFERLVVEGSPAVAADARNYLEYLNQIDKLIDLTKAHLRRST